MLINQSSLSAVINVLFPHMPKDIWQIIKGTIILKISIRPKPKNTLARLAHKFLIPQNDMCYITKNLISTFPPISRIRWRLFAPIAQKFFSARKHCKFILESIMVLEKPCWNSTIVRPANSHLQENRTLHLIARRFTII